MIGFAGEYCGYWVTPEEYDAQLYEGASTLYGREASVWLQDELVRLVRRAMDDAPDDDAESAAAPECAGVRPPRLAAAMDAASEARRRSPSSCAKSKSLFSFALRPKAASSSPVTAAAALALPAAAAIAAPNTNV